MGSSERLRRMRGRMRTRRDGTVEVEIDAEVPAVIARSPIEGGPSKFVRVDQLPNLNDLPFIPERQRDFAFRYAVEYKRIATWAKEYNVSPKTIEMWLRKPGVRQYIQLTKLEKRFYTMARRISLENLVYKRLAEWMTIRITGENAGAVARITEFAFKILSDPESVATRTKGEFNQNIYVGGTELKPLDGQSPYAQRDHRVSASHMEDLERRLERAHTVMERLVDMRKKNDTDGGEAEG